MASHVRSYVVGGHTTRDEHMPEAHRRHGAWTPARIISWAETNVGPVAAKLCMSILEHRRHPQQGYRACLGIIRLARRHDRACVEDACAKALAMKVYSSRFVDNVLRHDLDRVKEQGVRGYRPGAARQRSRRLVPPLSDGTMMTALVTVARVAEAIW